MFSRNINKTIYLPNNKLLRLDNNELYNLPSKYYTINDDTKYYQNELILLIGMVLKKRIALSKKNVIKFIKYLLNQLRISISYEVLDIVGINNISVELLTPYIKKFFDDLELNGLNNYDELLKDLIDKLNQDKNTLISSGIPQNIFTQVLNGLNDKKDTYKIGTRDLLLNKITHHRTRKLQTISDEYQVDGDILFPQLINFDINSSYVLQIDKLISIVMNGVNDITLLDLSNPADSDKPREGVAPIIEYIPVPDNIPQKHIEIMTHYAQTITNNNYFALSDLTSAQWQRVFNMAGYCYDNKLIIKLKSIMYENWNFRPKKRARIEPEPPLLNTYDEVFNFIKSNRGNITDAQLQLVKSIINPGQLQTSPQTPPPTRSILSGIIEPDPPGPLPTFIPNNTPQTIHSLLTKNQVIPNGTPYMSIGNIKQPILNHYNTNKSNVAQKWKQLGKLLNVTNKSDEFILAAMESMLIYI